METQEPTQEQQTQQKPFEQEVGAFWKRTSQKGQKYLAGHITVDGDPVKVVVFSNRNKDKDTQPDYRVYKSRPQGQASSEESQEQTPASAGDLL